MEEKLFLCKQWPKVREDLLLTLSSFEEADLVFVPVEGGWTVGRIMLHISSAAEFLAPQRNPQFSQRLSTGRGCFRKLSHAGCNPGLPHRRTHPYHGTVRRI